MLKIILLGTGILVLLVIAGGMYFYFFMMGKPMYMPGMVSEGKNLIAPLEPPAQDNHRKGYWKVENEIKIHYFSEGDGIPVLFVHGGPGYPVVKSYSGLNLLNDRLKTYYYHQRGCGDSTKPFDRFSDKSYYKNMTELEKTLGLGAQIADIERIRRLLKQEKIILIGHSFGAFISTLYAAEFPQNTRSLVLVSPAALLKMPSKNGDLFDVIKKELPDNIKEEYDAYLKDYFDFKNLFKRSESELAERLNGFMKFYAVAAEKRGIKLELSDAPYFPSNTGGWMTYAVFFSMGKKHDYTEALRKITSPVLIIHGARDFQTVEVSKRYHDVIANSELKVIEKASHFGFEETPEEFAKIVSKFILK